MAAQTQAQPPIRDYAIIGDCRTAALISRAGSIDWLCLPRFDGPSVFAAILDMERGGRFQVEPIGPYEVSRRYLPDTNVLETTFETPNGTARLTDAMTLPADADSRFDGLFPDHEIIRRVECVEGEVELDLVCDPRFDYGRRRPRTRDIEGIGLQFDGGADALLLRYEGPLRPHDAGDGWRAAAALRSGDTVRISLTTENMAPGVVCPLGSALDDRLDNTAAWWRGWLSKCSYEGEYEALVFRSMLTLKLLMFPPSGAIIAAPTTSLPETPGGSRNWDYRYCWLRDASMTLEVLLHLGFADEGEAFLGWLLNATRLTRPELQIMYDLYGRTDISEKELDHLDGYRGARPVRIGNGAKDQLQLDVYGEVIRAAWSFVEQGGDLDRAEAHLLEDAGATVVKRWREPDNGIWERRGERHPYTLSRAMCWVALDCLCALEDEGQVDLGSNREGIEAAAREIREAVEERGWDPSLESYTAWFGSDHMDAGLLLLGISGFHDPEEWRMESTRQRIVERLGDGGLLRRYDYDDGIGEREGAFGICGFWHAELLAHQGRLDEAREAFEHMSRFANDVGLFAEELDPDTGQHLGNFPQAFTHIGLVSAATEIARAAGFEPESRAEPVGDTHVEGEGS